MGPVCVVQHYVDMAPGPSAADHTCGSLTYDGHRGIDIRTRTRAQMELGVDVVAAASGIVRLAHDGEADRLLRTKGDLAAVGKRFSGNTVEIDHEDGWRTKYSHLKKGSVSVEQGDWIEAGKTLGQIGLSGRTQFPHVEFLLSFQDQPVDPFTGLSPGSGCGNFERSLWSDRTMAKLPYQRGGLLMSGLSGGVPKYPDILNQDAEPDLQPDPSRLVIWFVAWGLMTGDRILFRMAKPDGPSLAEEAMIQPPTQIEVFRYAGWARPASGWTKGTYRATIRIERSERGRTYPIAQETYETTLQ